MRGDRGTILQSYGVCKYVGQEIEVMKVNSNYLTGTLTGEKGREKDKHVSRGAS